MTAEEIRAKRKAANLTQEELAHEIGVTTNTVVRWEGGRRPQKLGLRVLRQFFERWEVERGAA